MPENSGSLLRRIGVSQDEQLPLALLSAQAFFSAFAMSLLEISATSLFLTEYGAERIPYVYIAIMVIVSLFS